MQAEMKLLFNFSDEATIHDKKTLQNKVKVAKVDLDRSAIQTTGESGF